MFVIRINFRIESELNYNKISMLPCWWVRHKERNQLSYWYKALHSFVVEAVITQIKFGKQLYKFVKDQVDVVVYSFFKKIKF